MCIKADAVGAAEGPAAIKQVDRGFHISHAKSRRFAEGCIGIQRYLHLECLLFVCHSITEMHRAL